MKIVKPTWRELIALEPPLAPTVPAIRLAARFKAYTFNAAPPQWGPWRTSPYTKAVYGGHVGGGTRWCTSVYARCTRGVRSSPSSALVKRFTGLLLLADGITRNRPTESTHYHGVPGTTDAAGPSKDAPTIVCAASPPAQRMALAVVHNKKQECSLIGRAPE